MIGHTSLICSMDMHGLDCMSSMNYNTDTVSVTSY